MRRAAPRAKTGGVAESKGDGKAAGGGGDSSSSLVPASGNKESNKEEGLVVPAGTDGSDSRVLPLLIELLTYHTTEHDAIAYAAWRRLERAAARAAADGGAEAALQAAVCGQRRHLDCVSRST